MFRTHDTPAPLPSPEDGPDEAVQVTPLPQVPAAYVALWSAPLVVVWGLVVGKPLLSLLALPLLGVAMLGTTPRRQLFWAVRRAARLPWRAWALLAGLAVAGWMWTEGWTLLSCAAALIGAAPIFTAALTGRTASSGPERTPPVKPGAEEEWRRRVEEKWPGTAARAGLHLPNEPATVPVLVQPPRVLGPGALQLRLNLEAAELAPEDVHAAVPTLLRGLRARYADVQAVDPHSLDLVDVTLWRGRHPLDAPVSYRDLAPVGRGGGEWIPVGRLATGGTAVLRWRYGTFISGAPETGKTSTQIAMLFGLRLQGIPVRLFVIDTLGDLRAWAPVLGDRYAATAKAGVPVAERWAQEIQDRYDQLGHGQEAVPDRGTPVLLMVVTEGLALRQYRAGYTKDHAGTLDTALRYGAAFGRRAAAATWIASQLPQKDSGDGGLGPLRDLLRQRVGHWVPDDSMVDPALGSGALERGARLHDLPEGLKGAAYVWDVESRNPVMMRPALIPPADRARVFGLRAA